MKKIECVVGSHYISLKISSLNDCYDVLCTLLEYVVEWSKLSDADRSVLHNCIGKQCAAIRDGRLDFDRYASASFVLDKSIIPESLCLPNWWVDDYWEVRAWIGAWRSGVIGEGDNVPMEAVEKKVRCGYGSSSPLRIAEGGRKWGRS